MTPNDRIRVPAGLIPHHGQGILPVRTTWEFMYAYILGNQDTLYSVLNMDAVPTFWSGDPSNIFETPQVDPESPPPDGPLQPFFYASIGGGILVIIYGLIHLKGCSSSSLATDTEWWLWSNAAIVIIAAPWLVALAWLSCITPICLQKEDWPTRIMLVASILASAAYIVARVILLVLACTSLLHLPNNVYQTAGTLPAYFQ